jgi:multiple sugar transport system substrate-binding protein
LGILVLAIIAAIVIFSQGSGSKSNSDQVIKVTVWGDIDPTNGLRDALSNFNQVHYKDLNVTYVYKSADTFDNSFIEAIADNKAPDLIFLSNAKILRLENKIEPITYAQLSIPTFQDRYVDAARTFLAPEGVLGVPLVLDPMVLYWNRDLFTNAGIINPPKYWDDVLAMQPLLTKRSDTDGSFDYSAIAMGEYANITHAKDIISTMLMQVGVPLVYRNDAGKTVVSVDSQIKTTGEPPVDSALRFYMDFANPNKTLYSWNRTLPESRDVFLADKLAMYIGRASDYKIIQERNPHLNFGIAQIPQMRTVSALSTGAEVYGLAVVKAGAQKTNALNALIAMVGDADFVSKWSKISLLPPARRDLLAKPQVDAVMPYFYDAALRSRAWLDPEETESSTAFGQMVEGLSSGRFPVPDRGANFLEQELSAIIGRLPQ